MTSMNYKLDAVGMKSKNKWLHVLYRKWGRGFRYLVLTIKLLVFRHFHSEDTNEPAELIILLCKATWGETDRGHAAEQKRTRYCSVVHSRCCRASSLRLSRSADTVLGPEWCPWSHLWGPGGISVPFLYMFSSLGSLGHCASCSVVHLRGVRIAGQWATRRHFFGRDVRRSLRVQRLKEDSWKRSLAESQAGHSHRPCCLLSKGWVTSCPLGKARERMGEQRSNSQVSSGLLSSSSMYLWSTNNK